MSAHNIMAGCGFARMAWAEACRRSAWSPSNLPPPSDRAGSNRSDKQLWSPDVAFFEMLDNATRGMSAYNAAYKLGMASENFTVRL